MKTQATALLSIVSLALLCSVVPCTSTLAEVRLPGFFGDHMVLQQEMPIRIWGWSDSGESVTVTLGEISQTTTAGENGRWQVELPARKADGQSLTLRVAGQNTIELKDVLIGEVWLCSGQSNMEWSVRQSSNASDEIANANHPMIRHIKFGRRPAAAPMDDISAEWQICSPETVSSFTAAGYFTAVTLHQELKVPIGLINSSWGGTRIEPWTSPIGLEQVDALDELYQSTLARTPGSPAYHKAMSRHLAETEAWLEEARTRLENNEVTGPNPAFPATLAPLQGSRDPTALYNGMIHALVGFPIRGALWYQGESNHGEGMLYFEKKKALIEGWRKIWKQGDFPFYFVQIAPFQYGNEAPEVLAEFWEAQAATLQLPNTGMVVINDIATLKNIHPPNKQQVGKRLAMLALKNDYGRSELVANSPTLESLTVETGQLRLKFQDTGGGLKTRDGKTPSHFEIVGKDSGGFQTAEATIDGDSIVLKAATVDSPVAFRFAWHKLAEPNLTGGSGLPVAAVRGGEPPTFLDSLPIADEYTLVYDLDLSRLSRPVKYDIDHSAQIRSFDRVGYLVELDSEEFGNQSVFVSMKAFSDDVNRIGIPTVDSQAVFQQTAEAMDIWSNVKGLKTGTSISAGNIEFWPNNYAAVNSGEVPGASDSVYDFGDQLADPVAGYGSMQIHNFQERQTVFSINHWSEGLEADLGIGNSPGNVRDWTFTKNAGTYTSKRLRIFVRQAN